MKKLVKNIVALGVGMAVVGMTLGGAMAYDLSQYPSPFVQNGQFNGYIVVGQNAKAADVIGATDIGMALQASNVVQKSIKGSEKTVVEGGQQIETTSNKLYYGTPLNKVKESFTKTEFPNLLASGTLVNDDTGVEYPYSVVVKNPGFDPKFGKPSGSDEENPIAYLDTNSGNYEIDINFDKAVNFAEDGLAGKEITLFGKTYTLGSGSTEMSPDKLTLYSAAVDQTFPAVGQDGPATEVDVGGKKVSVKVQGVATSGVANSAVIEINGETKTVTNGFNGVIGGQRVYVKGINVMQIPTSAGNVELFIGSNKIEFGTDEVKVGGKTLEGVGLVGAVNFSDLTSLKIQVKPSAFDEAKDYVKQGDELVDPLFGAFKYQFTGETPAYKDASREIVKIQPDGSKKIRIDFTNRDGQEISWSPYYYNDSAIVKEISGHDIKTVCNNSSNNITEDNYFVLNVGKGYTHVLELTKIRNLTDEHDIDVKDIATGDTQTFTYNSTGYGTLRYDGEEIPFKAGKNSSGVYGIYLTNTTNGDCSPDLYTKDGARIDINNTDKIIFNERNATWVTSTSDVENLTGNITFGISYDNTSKEMKVNKPAGSEELGDSNDYEYVTKYGTYVEYNSDSDKATLYYAPDATKYTVYFAPTEATAKVTSTGTTYEQVVPINPGVAVLDSEIQDPMDKNIVVVGGPCVNTVAATLLGNPSDCKSGFEQGKAMIKLFNHDNGKVALLVAGYAAMDTRRAARVLADYKDYASQLKGTEVIVSGTDLTNINIEAPAPAGNTTQ